MLPSSPQGEGEARTTTEGWIAPKRSHQPSRNAYTHGTDPLPLEMASGHGHGHGSSNAGAAWDGDSLKYLDVLREVYSSLVRTVASSSFTHTWLRGLGVDLHRIVPDDMHDYTTELPWPGARREHGARQQQPR